MPTRSVTITTSDGAGNETIRTVSVEVTQEQVNDETLRAQALAALTANRTYIARTSPTAAQTTAQVQALSQQNNGLIRLLLGLLDGTN